MGITKMIRFFEKSVFNAVRFEYEGLKICELGDQSMIVLDKNSRPQTICAKIIYSARGTKHTSIDITGNDGSLVINLDKQVPNSFARSFDVLTNYGTAEHVNNQFQVFENIHNMTRPGGLIIHSLPPAGQWPGHCRYYYSKEFATKLAKLCGYEIISLKVVKTFIESNQHPENYDFLMVAFLKKFNNHFPSFDEFAKLPILDTGDLTNMSGVREGYHRLGSAITVVLSNVVRQKPLSEFALLIISKKRLQEFFFQSLQLALNIKNRA